MNNRRKFLASVLSTIPGSLLAQGKKQTVAAISLTSNNGRVVTISTSGTKAAPSTRIVYWSLNWGDGHSISGNGSIPSILSNEYLQSGIYIIRLEVQDSKRYFAFDEIQLMFVRGPIPIITASIYGPQASITCPVGAVPILVGSTTASRQTLINANPGASFCLAAGVHFATGSNSPTTNQKFYGQYGAIIDGTAWSRPEADPDASPFKAIANGVTGVEIYNLVIRNCPKYGVNAYLVSGWKVDHCEISGNLTGVSVGSSGRITNNYIHHNIGNTGDPDPALRGGGYAISQTNGVLMDTNEISYNGTEQKFIGSGLGTDNLNYTITNNYAHHNIGNGIWNDGYGAGGVIQDNICDSNGQNGIVTEKGKSITVNRNTVRNNIQSGILNTESRDCTYTNNTLDGNAIALDLFVDLDDVGTSAWGIDLRDNIWQNNTVTVPNAPSVNFATVLSHVGVGDFTLYTLNTKNNNFNFNIYNVRSSTDNWWNFGSNMNWATWQALPQDAAGTRNIIP